MKTSDQNPILRHIFLERGDNDRQDIIEPADSALGNIDTKHDVNSDWVTSAAGNRIHQLHIGLSCSQVTWSACLK